jgi:hypothetical protein
MHEMGDKKKAQWAKDQTGVGQPRNSLKPGSQKGSSQIPGAVVSPANLERGMQLCLL